MLNERQYLEHKGLRLTNIKQKHSSFSESRINFAAEMSRVAFSKR